MKRDQMLKRLRFTVPENAKIRVIVDTDAKNEADDQFAIIHHLLTPSFDIRGIVAAHFEHKEGFTRTSMERSYQEVVRLLSLAQIDDVPVYRGCVSPLSGEEDTPESEGVEFIIREARREDPRPLYIAVQGAMTNVAAALNCAPDIGSRITVLWNGGGPYPTGRPEFNVMQDPAAVRVLLRSSAAVWQTTQEVYSAFEVTLSEIAEKVGSCGALGAYLLEQLETENRVSYNPAFPLRTGENWTLGDNATVSALLQTPLRGNWHEHNAPVLTEDLLYASNPKGKTIRVYDRLDVRMALEDLFSKLRLVYGAN